MSQLFYGSLCVSDLIEEFKKKHSAFEKGKNGKIYAKVNVWLNDNEDDYGNILSIQLNPTKEMRDIDRKVYVGNCKKSEFEVKPPSDKDRANIAKDFENADDGLPF